MVAVPGLTYGNMVLCMSSGTREFKRRQRGDAGRLALGVQKHIAVETIHGELGWSTFMAREAVAKFLFELRLSRLPETHVA